jgi:hypothetical protein
VFGQGGDAAGADADIGPELVGRGDDGAAADDESVPNELKREFGGGKRPATRARWSRDACGGRPSRPRRRDERRFRPVNLTGPLPRIGLVVFLSNVKRVQYRSSAGNERV